MSRGGEREAVTASDIRLVRKKTGAGTIDCRKALEAVGGDVEKAVEYLKERGIGGPKRIWT